MELKQSSIFDVIKETNKGIQKSFDNANTEWRDITLENLKRYCEYTPTFTMNDFRDHNKFLCGKIQSHDNRAYGGVVATARKMGWIEPTGDSIISKVGHKSPLQIWKSLIFIKTN